MSHLTQEEKEELCKKFIKNNPSDWDIIDWWLSQIDKILEEREKNVMAICAQFSVSQRELKTFPDGYVDALVRKYMYGRLCDVIIKENLIKIEPQEYTDSLIYECSLKVLK
jgi:hypothetical protein